MERELIDFDRRFQEYLREWMRNCRGRYGTVEDMEEDMPSVYGKWTMLPARWLDGATPAEFFYRFEDGGMLVEWMLRYMASDIGVPDPLLDRIASLGKAAEEPLLRMLREETPLPGRRDRQEVLTTAINLLTQIQSTAPMDDYIRIVASNEDGELAEAACEALAAMGNMIAEPVLAALEAPLPGPAVVNLVDVLADVPGDPRILGWLLRMFEQSDMKALFASDLGKYGDDAALPALIRAQTLPGITYLDYIEIRNAIEQLGGEPEPMRDFSGDPDYEALKEV